jgi:hypothetical protein
LVAVARACNKGSIGGLVISTINREVHYVCFCSLAFFQKFTEGHSVLFCQAVDLTFTITKVDDALFQTRDIARGINRAVQGA